LKIWWTSTALDVNGFCILSNWLDGLSSWIKEEDLVVVLSVVSLDN
jgi:hypothetical protein